MKLFICYSRVDLPTCKKLVSLLDAHEVWYDQNLVGGQLWWHTILEKIDWCEGFVHLLTPESVASTYCQKECEIALSTKRIVLPVIIQDRTIIPQYLANLQTVNLTRGLDEVEDVVQFFNALFEAERRSRATTNILTIEQFSAEDNIPPKVEKFSSHPDDLLPYNYVFRLDQRNLSQQTKTSYYFWLCEFLETIANAPHVERANRKAYLSNIPVGLLRESLSVAQVKAWLGMIIAEGRQASQARSAIIILAKMLAEDEIIEDSLVYKLQKIASPSQSPKNRHLSLQEVEKLIKYIEQANAGMDLRDALGISLAFVLRSSEISSARWSNIQTIADISYFKDGDKSIQLPRVAINCLKKWFKYVITIEGGDFPNPDSFLVRAFLRSNSMTKDGVSPRAIGKRLEIVSAKAGISSASLEIVRISVQRLSTNYGVSILFR